MNLKTLSLSVLAFTTTFAMDTQSSILNVVGSVGAATWCEIVADASQIKQLKANSDVLEKNKKSCVTFINFTDDILKVVSGMKITLETPIAEPFDFNVVNQNFRSDLDMMQRYNGIMNTLNGPAGYMPPPPTSYTSPMPYPSYPGYVPPPLNLDVLNPPSVPLNGYDNEWGRLNNIFINDPASVTNALVEVNNVLRDINTRKSQVTKNLQTVDVLYTLNKSWSQEKKEHLGSLLNTQERLLDQVAHLAS